jgi:hypothetical protein
MTETNSMVETGIESGANSKPIFQDVGILWIILEENIDTVAFGTFHKRILDRISSIPTTY